MRAATRLRIMLPSTAARSAAAFLFLFLLLTLVLSSGCDSRSTQTSPSGASPPAVEEVRLGYFANLTHAQAVLGVSSGELAQVLAPAKVRTKLFNAGPTLIEAINAGAVDIGYIGPGPAISAHGASKGAAIRVIAGAAANGVLIVARPESGINTLADLVGKRIATPQLGNTQDISARHYLASELKQQDLGNVRPVANAEQLQMMRSQGIDAAWDPEPWGSRLIVETGAKLIAEEKDLWPGKQFNLTLVITTPKFLAEHPEIVEKVLRVHRSWTARLQADPGKYQQQLEQALFDLTRQKLPPGVMPMALSKVQFIDDPLEETLRTMAQWTYELRMISQPVDLTGLVDLTILHKLQQAEPTPPATAPAAPVAKG